MIVNHNMSSIIAFNRLNKNNKSANNAIEKLSSGLQINQAADDAAGLAISEKMRAQIRGLDQVQRNIQDGISLIQIAEAGLSKIIDPPLQRMRELLIQSSNDTLTPEDRQAIQRELTQLINEVDSIANNTEFNSMKLINGSNKIVKTTVTIPENIIWEEVNTGSTTNFFDIAYDGEKFLAVGFEGKTLISPDGENWSVPSTPVTNSNLISINWDGNQFLITEGSGIYTTTDGINRTGYSQGIEGISGHFFDAEYVGGKYLAVGENGQIATTENPALIDSWSSVTSGITEKLYDVASSGNEYIIVGENGTVLRSTDAINWTEQDSGTDKDLMQVIWDSEKYVAVGSSGVILTSQDGVSWTKQNTPTGISVIQDIIHHNNEYVAVSRDGWILTSKDGETWDGTKINGYLEGIETNGEEYVVIGLEGKALKGSRKPIIHTEIEYDKKHIQIGANSNQSLALEMSDVRSSSLEIDDISVSTMDSRDSALVKVDNAIEKVSSDDLNLGPIKTDLNMRLIMRVNI